MHAPLLCFRKPSAKGKSVRHDDGRRKREAEEGKEGDDDKWPISPPEQVPGNP